MIVRFAIAFPCYPIHREDFDRMLDWKPQQFKIKILRWQRGIIDLRRGALRFRGYPGLRPCEKRRDPYAVPLFLRDAVGFDDWVVGLQFGS